MLFCDMSRPIVRRHHEQPIIQFLTDDAPYSGPQPWLVTDGVHERYQFVHRFDHSCLFFLAQGILQTNCLSIFKSIYTIRQISGQPPFDFMGLYVQKYAGLASSIVHYSSNQRAYQCTLPVIHVSCRTNQYMLFGREVTLNGKEPNISLVYLIFFTVRDLGTSLKCDTVQNR